MDQHSFGYWLRLKRKALDLTREELAFRVGYSAITIRKIEAEERRPSAQIIERLVEILNVPQNERAAFLEFARGDWKSVPSEASEKEPWRISNGVAHSNLPATTTSLIGRDHEITLVCEYLFNPDIRLVTLSGAPGIGKTRLSIAAARAALPYFHDHVFFVPLDSLDNPGLLASTIAQTMGYVTAKNAPANEQLVDGIGEKQILLVLDNCEHLVDTVAALVRDLLRSCPQLKILATSRESLRVAGEWIFPVPMLKVPDENKSISLASAAEYPALTLFGERARAVKPDFALDSVNIAAVSAICTRLDGIPLAIELAAARLNLLSPEELAARLKDAFQLLTQGARTTIPRQQTLRATIDWSFQLLSPGERILLRRLAVFSGTFLLEAVEAVCSGDDLPPEEIMDHLSGLINKSMLKIKAPVESGLANDIPVENRFQLLESVRQYGFEKLNESGESQTWRNRHLAYYLAKAEAAEFHLRGARRLECTRYLTAELANFRAAVDWSYSGKAETISGLRIAAAISRQFMRIIGLATEAIDWLLTGLQVQSGGDVSPLLEVRALNSLGGLGFVFSDFRNSFAWITQSIQICRLHPTGPEMQAELSFALSGLARCSLLNLGDLSEVEAIHEESIAIAHRLPLDLGWYLSQSLHAASMFSFITLNRRDKALQYAEEGRQIEQTAGDRWSLTGAWILGCQAADQGQDQQAQFIFDDALKRFIEVGDRHGAASTHAFLGRLFRQKGLVKQALFHDQEYLRQWHEMGSHLRVNDSFLMIGLDRISQAGGLSGSARAACYREAALLFGAAARLRKDYRSFIMTGEENMYQVSLGMVKSELGEPGFQAAWESGKSLTHEEVYAIAMNLS